MTRILARLDLETRMLFRLQTYLSTLCFGSIGRSQRCAEGMSFSR